MDSKTFFIRYTNHYKKKYYEKNSWNYADNLVNGRHTKL